MKAIIIKPPEAFEKAKPLIERTYNMNVNKIAEIVLIGEKM